MAEARPLVNAERSKDCVALTAKDQPRGASPGKLLKEGFLAHCGFESISHQRRVERTAESRSRRTTRATL
jgi:hypothetical protein